MDRLEAGQPLPVQYGGSVIALGNFDGFHPGHQAVVRQAVTLAHACGVAALVATFDPHPVRYFRPNSPSFLLTTLAQRERLAREAGADAMLVFRFDHELASVPADNFVQRFFSQAGAIITGADFAFGRDRQGDVASLARSSRQAGLISFAVTPVLSGGETVSSTRIRQALRDGDCATATRLLTRPYKVEGDLQLSEEEVTAESMARATIDLGEYLCPRAGTYTVRLRRVDGRFHDGFARVCDVDANGVAPRQLQLFLNKSTRWQPLESVQVSFLARMQEAKVDQPS